MSTVSDLYILDKPSDTLTHTILHIHNTCICALSAISFMSSAAKYYAPGLQKLLKLADVITKNLVRHHALLAAIVPLKYYTLSLTLLSEAPK